MNMQDTHKTAIVSLDAWEFNSPRVKAMGIATDIGLLASALVYYDEVVVEIQNSQTLADIAA
jgi:hypothetical protein